MRIRSQVAGLFSLKGPVSPLSNRAAVMASLMAKNTDAARNNGGSPTAWRGPKCNNQISGLVSGITKHYFSRQADYNLKMSYALLKCFSVLLSVTEVPSRALTAVLTVCSNVRRTDPCVFVRSSYVTSTRMCSNRKLMSSLGEIGTLLLQCIQTKKTTIRSCIQQCTYLTNESCTKSCKQQGFRSLSKLSTETTPGFQYCLR